MAYVDTNIFYGGYIEDLYKYTKPQISMRLVGVKNNGGYIGYASGETGMCEQILPDDATYDKLNAPNFIIGVQSDVDSNNANGYISYVSANYGMLGEAKGEKFQNYQNSNNNSFESVSRNFAIGGFYFLGQIEEYKFENNVNQLTGKKTNFYIEITANCPIIRLTKSNYRYFYTAKDGTLKLFNNKTVISDVRADTILNSIYTSPPKEYLKYYIYNTWDDDDTTTVKKLDVETENQSSLCLYVNDNISGAYDTSLYFNGGETYEKVTFDINGTASEYNYIPQNALSYTYHSKFGIYVSQFTTNIPIFDSMDKVNQYLTLKLNNEDTDDLVKNDALNASDVLASNETASGGISITTTDLNDGYSRNVFNKMFSCEYGAISEIGANIFNTDTSVQSAIFEGLKLYGANPMDCIIDLSYYPFDINAVVDTASQKQIFFGSYMMTLENSVNLIGRPRTIIDMGEVMYSPIFNDFRDYEPYSQLYIYLPYCGYQKLDISNYYKKSISLKYIIDFTSGGCKAVLSANDVIIDTFDGTIGIKQSISSIDYNAYSRNVTENLGNAVKAIGGQIMPLAKTGGDLSKIKGDSILSGVLDAGGAIYDSYQSINSQRITVRGAGVPSSNMCLPQYAYTYCVYNKQIRPSNELALVGYPSNSGGKVKDFKGYLKCSKVSINTTATNAEKAKIYNLLQSGIYVN